MYSDMPSPSTRIEPNFVLATLMVIGFGAAAAGATVVVGVVVVCADALPPPSTNSPPRAAAATDVATARRTDRPFWGE